MHRTSLLSTPGQFGPVVLPEASKNDDEEHYFLKKFGFRAEMNATHLWRLRLRLLSRFAWLLIIGLFSATVNASYINDFVMFGFEMEG